MPFNSVLSRLQLIVSNVQSSQEPNCYAFITFWFYLETFHISIQVCTICCNDPSLVQLACWLLQTKKLPSVPSSLELPFFSKKNSHMRVLLQYRVIGNWWPVCHVHFQSAGSPPGLDSSVCRNKKKKSII